MDELKKTLSSLAGSDCVLEKEEMRRHTTFRIGGPADLFVTPKTIPAAADVIRFCRKRGIPFYILGNGSNLLVSDRGIPGRGDSALPESQPDSDPGNQAGGSGGSHAFRHRGQSQGECPDWF